MARRKTKYTLRPDGRIMMVKAMPDGKRRSFYGHSDDEVERKYREALAEAERKPKGRLFKEIAEEYWTRKEPSLSPNSRVNYHCCYERAVKEFGDTPVADITAHDIYAFLSGFAMQGFSGKVIGLQKTVIKSVLDMAFASKDIDVNPCLSVPAIKSKKARVARQPATDSDMELVDKHRNDSDIARMYYFMAYTGLRRGEATALQYKHIDWEHKTVAVVQSCAWENSKPILKTPKTEAGKRTVEITDNALEVIPQGHDPEEFIFFPDGLPRRGIIDTRIRQYLRDTGVKATPHQLRHSYASLLHSAGVDVKDAQHLLGHSTVALTQDIYTHLDSRRKTDVQSKLNNYVKSIKQNER